MVYRVVDFFCGAGGFSEGFHQAGFEVIKAFDIWEPAIKTHNKNHPSVTPIATYGNVLEISKLDNEEFEKVVPDSEVIIGSPPCVAFSSSNRSGKADKTLGIVLLEAYLRIVARKRFKSNSVLKYWILENVSNIEKYIQESYTMQDLGLTGDDILRVKKESAGVYKMQFYNVPSTRKRYICGEFPAPCSNLTEDNLTTLQDVTDSLGLPLEKKDDLIRDINYNFEIPGNLVTDHHYLKEIADFEWEKAKRQKQDKGYMGRMSFPENMEKPARTIMATMSGSSRESFILPIESNRYRYPTIREVATVMSFPIDYRFYGDSDSVKYKLVGNAVPPKFSYALACAINSDKNLNNDLSTKRKEFDKEDGFINLNGKEYELKKEKEKNRKAKFKYHIPYLKINTFRTELLNSFNNDKVKWSVEIHRSQGKNAEVYKGLKINLSFMTSKEIKLIDNFKNYMIKEIESYEKLQSNYRKTTKQKTQNKLIGPYELLSEIKKLLVDNFNHYDENILVEGVNKEVPQKILITYYVLDNIILNLKN
ncbi:DNA (cytosine-5)-methyltransferase 1 [Alkalibacterium putridalgicola]|uniref:DNA (cytosine-5-)-methyltransferase n=1 Tax=Alkalibacterium putridalgicola TaxID=426703 RepID=A0A1H7XG09_9LACT|nr:DNA cytosine methyltransferase [Alkalibacterium putridalgicola]GEK90279.1 hypothetical protein APU01nite_23180 [Alkalibacterium putridalgicola]SEM32700.1 DNA (cytosine-5)-methyltransferase 1 [Alkalibacterium putridalgicola]